METKYKPSRANTKIFVEKTIYFDYSPKKTQIWLDVTADAEVDAVGQNTYVTTPFLEAGFAFKKNSTP